MNRLKAGWPKGKKKSSKGAPSSLASYGPGAPPLQSQRSSQALPPLIEDCLAWLEAHRGTPLSLDNNNHFFIKRSFIIA
jgi:hypothetical protein